MPGWVGARRPLPGGVASSAAGTGIELEGPAGAAAVPDWVGATRPPLGELATSAAGEGIGVVSDCEAGSGSSEALPVSAPFDTFSSSPALSPVVSCGSDLDASPSVRSLGAGSLAPGLPCATPRAGFGAVVSVRDAEAIAPRRPWADGLGASRPMFFGLCSVRGAGRSSRRRSNSGRRASARGDGSRVRSSATEKIGLSARRASSAGSGNRTVARAGGETGIGEGGEEGRVIGSCAHPQATGQVARHAKSLTAQGLERRLAAPPRLPRQECRPASAEFAGRRPAPYIRSP